MMMRMRMGLWSRMYARVERMYFSVLYLEMWVEIWCKNGYNWGTLTS